MPKFIPFEKFPKLERRLRRIVVGGKEAQPGTKAANNRRDALAVLIGLHGLRVEEVSNLTIGDLDTTDDMLQVMTIKNGRPRRISLGEGVAKRLKKLAGKRKEHEPLFATGKGKKVFPSHWQRYARELTKDLFGAPGFNFHAMRHTHAMRLYHKTKDMQRVRARLGHKSMKSTDVYIEAYGQLDDARLERIGRIDVLPSLVKHRRRPAKADRQPFGRSTRKGQAELFETTKPARKNTKKPREPDEKPRNVRTNSRSTPLSRKKTTRFRDDKAAKPVRKSKKGREL
jgi:hypothetical protein